MLIIIVTIASTSFDKAPAYFNWYALLHLTSLKATQSSSIQHSPDPGTSLKQPHPFYLILYSITLFSTQNNN